MGGGKDQYLERLKHVGTFRSVVDFWRHFNHLKVPRETRVIVVVHVSNRWKI